MFGTSLPATRGWDLRHADTIAAVAISPDGHWIATASHDKTAAIWDVATGRQRQRLEHGNLVLAVAISPSSEWLATGSSDKTGRIWDAETGREAAGLSIKDLSAT